MTALTLPTLANALETRAIDAALSSLAPHTRRCYSSHIRHWQDWRERGNSSSRLSLDREHVKQYLRSLDLSGKSAQVQNQALAALKRLASESAELDWIEPQTAAQIRTIKARKATGIRTGRWLTSAQTAQLLAQCDPSTIPGLRDAAILALLVGCGIRRDEACQLETAQIKETSFDSRTITLLTNLTGKGGRVRTIRVPAWAAQILANWHKEITKKGVVESTRFLRSARWSHIEASLSPAAVRDIIRKLGTKIGIPDLNPHDLRRTHAKLARLGGAPLETIQHSLGHASLKTTEIYLRTGEEANAGDYIRL